MLHKFSHSYTLQKGKKNCQRMFKTKFSNDDVIGMNVDA